MLYEKPDKKGLYQLIFNPRYNLGFPIKMEGAGRCYLNPQEKVAKFYGKSQGFQTDINPDHLKELNEVYSDWKFETE